MTVCGKILQPYSTTKPYVKTLSDLSIFKGISNTPQHIISHLFTKKISFFIENPNECFTSLIIIYLYQQKQAFFGFENLNWANIVQDKLPILTLSFKFVMHAFLEHA